MAYDTTADINGELAVGNKGIVITVKKDDDILGHLMIGKANIHWFKKSKKNKAYKVSWADFAEWIEEGDEVDATRP